MSFIYGLKNSDRFVYHYTSPDIALNFILKDLTLRFGPYSATNDPKEAKAWSLSVVTRQGYLGDDHADPGLPLRVAAWLKSNAYLCCFSSDAPSLTGDHTKDILLRGLAKPRMWAQYADRHRGFCLVFDKSRLIDCLRKQVTDRLIFEDQVTYRDRPFLSSIFRPNAFSIEYDELREQGFKIYCHNHAIRHIDELYFEKLTDWRDESEWRLLFLGSVSEPPLVDISDALTGVVHGADVSETDEARALELTKGLDVGHVPLVWSNHCPWYDFHKPMPMPAH